MSDRYQSSATEPGTMPTGEWFAALMRGVDAPLGSVLDVGCAEGVMCQLATGAGAATVIGIGLHDDRMEAARRVEAKNARVAIYEQTAAEWSLAMDSIVFSMMAHWLGKAETARFAKLARRYFLVIFREANDHYAIPENGSWFPTLEEMDETVGGIRTHEEVVLEQDNGKRTIAATYRMDMTVKDGKVTKRRNGKTVVMPLAQGHDLHGDEPFRPTHGAPLVELTPDEQAKVRVLVKGIASASLATGTYPTDLSPRNIIVGEQGAFLVDLEEIEPYPGAVAPEFLAIWQHTLSTIGVTFTGDLRSLL